MTQDTQPLEEAIHSIFRFIQRTAEVAETSTTWETINYENQPQHDISVFNGVGGIGFFLAAYAKRYGNTDALALAEGSVDWCAAFKCKHYQRGLHIGQTGAALAALHCAAVRSEATAPAFSLANARFIMSEPPGPVTDLLGGAASNGLYLLKLRDHTGNEIYLRGAERCAAWIGEQLIRDERGTYCYSRPRKQIKSTDRIYI